MFGFDPYHVALAALGAAIILAYWLPRFFSGREPAASALLVLLGLASVVALPDLPRHIDPLSHPLLWEVAAELCVIVGLFGTGLRIDRMVGWRKWRPTLRLLLIAMPLTVAATALLGWGAGGMTLAGGLLLGAILSPTDPVLAGDVQVGPPLEGGEHPVRLALTTEAGLNDGLAFPFVHLGVLVAAAGAMTFELAGEWLVRDLLYRVLAGAAAGMGTGWFLGRIMFVWPKDNALSRTESGVIGLAGVLLAYGATELIEGYGFIAAFAAGVTLRRQESADEFHRKLHDFTESLEHALTALILVALGAVLPMLWPHLGWPQVILIAGLMLVIRPLAAWLSLGGSEVTGRQRAVIAFYGVRGIGSIYYLAYAGHQIELVDEPQLWATIAFTVLASTVIHGLSAGVAVDRVTRAGEAGADAKARV